MKDKDGDGDEETEENPEEKENKFFCPYCLKEKPCCVICEVKKHAANPEGTGASVAAPVVEWAELSATPTLGVAPMAVDSVPEKPVEPSAGLEASMVVDSSPEKFVEPSSGVEAAPMETAGSGSLAADQNTSLSQAVGETPAELPARALEGSTVAEDPTIAVEKAVVDGTPAKPAPEATSLAAPAPDDKPTEPVPEPVPEPAKLFRCSRCYFLAHIDCLIPYYENFVEAEAEGFVSGHGEKQMREKWHCTDCLVWDVDVDTIITYRDGEPQDERWLPAPLVNGKSKSPRQYYIKFENYSWIHAEWVTERWLGSLTRERLKLKRFLDACSDENREAKLDKRPLVWPKSVEDAVPKECITYEKVFDVTYRKEKAPKTLDNVDQVLVKWLGCSVGATSWENVPEEGTEDWNDVKRGYERFLKNQGIARSWDREKKEKKFAEYTEQPEWIVGGKLKEYQVGFCFRLGLVDVSRLVD